MLLKDLADRQVDGCVAPGQKNVVLTDILQIVIDSGQSFHAAPVLTVALLCVTERGQNAQAAVLAAQVPVLAGTQVVQKGLVALVYHYAYVANYNH